MSAAAETILIELGSPLDPQIARLFALSDAYAAALIRLGAEVSAGVFGAHMQVELVNDGPVTIILDSDQWGRRPGR